MYYANKEKYPMLSAHLPDRPEFFSADTFIIDESFYGKINCSIASGKFLIRDGHTPGDYGITSEYVAEFAQEAATYYRARPQEVEAYRERESAEFMAAKRMDQSAGFGIIRTFDA